MKNSVQKRKITQFNTFWMQLEEKKFCVIS